MSKVNLQIQGMTCQVCANRLEKILNKKDFIQQAHVSFANEQAQVQFDEKSHSVQDILQIIKNAGFTGTPMEDASRQNTEAGFSQKMRLVLLLILCTPFLFMMLGMMTHQHQLMLPVFWQWLLASAVQWGLAIPFYRSAWQSLQGRLANMDVLVSLGTLSIYFYSTFAYFLTQDANTPVYFEASVMVITFVSLGKYLEHRTKSQSLNALNLLMQLTPKRVSLYRESQWQSIPLDQVKIGDILRANQGERIAADGIVESGEAWVDESHLTGEFKAENKTSGATLLAGALLKEGSLVYRAQQLGQQTLLGDMVQALAEAQNSKAPIARIADKVAGVFVPIVMGIALLTFLVTFYWTASALTALIHAVSVLVIACPCALGLATPAAIMVGMGKAVQRGIRFKDAASMEATAKVNCVVFDKTGTLTEGQPHIADIWLDTKCGYSEQMLYALAASIEQYSNHPLAKTITDQARQKGISVTELTNVQSELGAGLQVQIEELGRVKIGSPAYCQWQMPDDLDPLWQIASIVAVEVNEKVVGAFAITDALKAGCLAEIQCLQAQNIELYIMSGDRQSAVQYVADQLKITQAYGELSPRDKAEKIQQLKAQGKVVAMVGDGINDTPALATAQVSFAMQTGTDIAQHTASAVLMHYSINQLTEALSIARATFKNIKQNLFLAFIYNLLAIPLAAFGYLTPVLAGLAMSLSSLSVLFNALRLKAQQFRKN